MAYKFTPEVRKKILDALRSGATQRLAAEYAGIHRDTLADWLKQAEKDGEDSEFHEFAVEYAQARGQQAKLLLDRIKTIGDTINSWQAHAWILEHSFPKDYGRSIFGGDPNETPEIRHVIEIIRDNGPELEKESKVYDLPGSDYRHQIEGPNRAADDQDAEFSPLPETT